MTMRKISNSLCNPGQSYSGGYNSLQHYQRKPLITDGCIVMICTKGFSSISVNFSKQVFREGDVALVFSDVLFVPYNKSALFEVAYISLPKPILEEAFYKITSLPFWDFICQYPILRPSKEQFKLILNWHETTKWVIDECVSDFQTSILSKSIYNLLLAIYSEITRNEYIVKHRIKKDRSWELINKFAFLINKHCEDTRDVNFYANEMCITTDYLYKITTNILHQSPKEIIDQYVIARIKALLTGTDMTINDIAQNLKFEYPSYMCRFFKRKTGYTLVDFRKSALE